MTPQERKVIEHYEAALKEAFPRGATGDVFYHWNEARKLLEQQPAVSDEPVEWRNAAIRVGEDLCSVGPFGYYDMTAEQWLDWALSVVTVHQPKREWVGLTDGEIEACIRHVDEDGIGLFAFARAIEAKLKEKNT